VLRTPKFLLAALATLVAGGALAVFGRLPSPWEPWRPATCMPDACFCEQIRDVAVRQPSNTVSGLAFVFVALVAVLAVAPGGSRAVAGGADAPGAVSRQWDRGYAVIFAAAMFAVGAGSIFYHASLTFWGQTVDVLAMYLVVTFFLLVSATRRHPLSFGKAAALYLGCNAMLLWLLIALPEVRREVFALLVLLLIGSELLHRRRTTRRASGRSFLAAVGVLAAGFAIWVVDYAGIVCAPTGVVQGHAIWHVAGALSGALAYVHFRATAIASMPPRQQGQ
jgi:hypothetical protein